MTPARGETSRVCKRMKHRWVGVPLLTAAVALGACAPPQQGTDVDEEESDVPATMGATQEPAATSEATPDFDYDY